MDYSSEFKSLYIPYIPNGWTEERVRDLFIERKIGYVERVDFVDAGNWKWAKSAYVHLAYWEYNLYTDSLYWALESGSGQWRLNMHGMGEGDRFLILRKMTTPKLPSTHLNIHQMAAKIADMEAEIAELRNALECRGRGQQDYDDRDVYQTGADGAAADASASASASADASAAYQDTSVETLTEIFNKLSIHAKRERLQQECDGSSDDDQSDDSFASKSKRMRFSAELCGNN